MFSLILIGALLAVVAGLIVMVVLNKTSLRDAGTITLTELVLGALVCTIFISPVVGFAGFHIARAQAMTFNEYWSGEEKSYDVDSIRCEKDGSCKHEYDCDSYWVTETYTDTETYTKSDGTTGTRSVTKTRQVEKWHSCPYVNTEYTYTVSDTLGETYTMGDHWFPKNPAANRWRGSGYNDDRWGSYDNLPNVSTGEPSLWVKAKARIDAGTPGGTTQVHTYKNYILASSKDIYEKASGAIDAYKKAGLLPKPSSGVHDHYLADKAYFIGAAPGSEAQWQESVMRFNGALGSERQGDLHLLVVTDDTITNPDEYTNAVMAYWQSPDLKRNALSKNGYVVVVGSTDGTTVEWARGFSGMPIGNERLNIDIREDLTGTALTPEALLGTADEKSINGALGTIMFAENTGFERVEMKNYTYLIDQIQPSGTQRFVILLIGFLFALALWGVLVFVDVRLPKGLTAAWSAARTDKAVDDEIADLKYDQYNSTTNPEPEPDSAMMTRAKDLHNRMRRITNP